MFAKRSNIADGFARFFQSVFSNLDNKLDSFKQYYLNTVFVNQALSLSQFNDKEILETANKIKSNSIGQVGH